MDTISGILGGSDPTVQQASTLSPEQEELIAQIAAQNQQYGGGLAATLSQLAGAPQSAYQAADPAMLEGRLSQIQLQTDKRLADALSSGERFSSGNMMNRARIAQAGGLAQRGQVLDFENRERLLRTQAMQDAYSRQLAAAGQLSGYLTSPLGVNARENIVMPGSQGIGGLLGAGLGLGLTGGSPAGGMLGYSIGSSF
jgi:hypothetical protein